MAKLEMKVPSPGESISEVEIAAWLVADGDYVVKDQAIAEVDSDKATLELPAEESGTITLMAAEGDVVKVGQVVCLIDTSAAKPAGITTPEKEIESPKSASNAIPQPSPNPDPIIKADNYAAGTASPAASKLMAENKVSPNQVVASGKDGRITKQDVNNAIAKGFDNASISVWGGSREIRREKMSMLRRKIAERLVSVKNETAMLTTFNEVDMKPIMDLRAKYKDAFAKKHEVNLGFMSFFTKAVTEALNIYPAVNGQIQNGEISYEGSIVNKINSLMDLYGSYYNKVSANADRLSKPSLYPNPTEIAWIKSELAKVKADPSYMPNFFGADVNPNVLFK